MEEREGGREEREKDQREEGEREVSLLVVL